MAHSPVSRRSALGLLGGVPVALLLPGCSRNDAPAGATSPGAPLERRVERLVAAQPSVDGAGVKLRRALGSRALPMLDPFLMLDEIHSDRAEDFVNGFPTHPHRGFETVTYVVDGAVEHADSLGNRGHLGTGSVQWMTAGRGIVHSEMPKDRSGTFWGFQLWVNLPAEKKMTKPRYQDLAPDRVVELSVDDARVRLVAGEAAGRHGPVDGIVTSPLMMDLKLPPHGRTRQALPRAHNAFLYVFEGEAAVADDRAAVKAGELAVLSEGDRVTIASEGGARLLLFAGRPLGEPVARRGPFVMNTEAEIQRAIEDYRAGTLTAG